MARVFKARMILYAAYGHCIIREVGSYYEHPRWFELAKEMGTSLQNNRYSVQLLDVQGFEYDRKEYKKETRRIIRESME